MKIVTDVKDYEEQTVVIAAPTCTSIKVMCSLSVTKHLVTEEWLHTCHNLKHLVPTSEYTIYPYIDAIGKGERIRAEGNRLLTGKSVHRMMGTNGPKYNKPSFDELKNLVEVACGEWVSTKRRASNCDARSLLILMDDDDFDKPRQTQYVQALLDKGASKIRWSDLKTCLLAQSLESILHHETHKPQSRVQRFKESLTALKAPCMNDTCPRKDDDVAEEEAEEEAELPTNYSSDDDATKSEVPLDQEQEEDVTASTPSTEGAPSTSVLKTPSRNNRILVYSTELKHLTRNLSNLGGDRNRSQLGAGMMNVMKSGDTGLLTVQVFNKNGLQFQSEVPQDYSGFFGNAGRENILGWNAYDTSGNIPTIGTAIKEGKAPNVKEASMRRFFFHFETREHLTCVLFILFGGNDTARKLVEEFYDGNGRFCPKEEPELPHRVIDPNHMEVDDINGLSPTRPTAPTSRLTFENDPFEASQIY